MKRFFILLAIAAFIVVYAMGDVMSEHWLLQCPLYHLTGWQCPLCGLQRGLHAALNGRFAEAWHYNPGFWLMAPYWLLWMAGGLSKRLAAWEPVKWCSQDKVLFTATGILLLWGVIRNIQF